MPRGRRGAARAVGERARARSCAVGRSRAGEARLEVSNNAREYGADAARLQLASVLDVQPCVPAARRGGRRARGGRAGVRRALLLR